MCIGSGHVGFSWPSILRLSYCRVLPITATRNILSPDCAPTASTSIHMFVFFLPNWSGQSASAPAKNDQLRLRPIRSTSSKQAREKPALVPSKHAPLRLVFSRARLSWPEGRCPHIRTPKQDTRSSAYRSH